MALRVFEAGHLRRRMLLVAIAAFLARVAFAQAPDIRKAPPAVNSPGRFAVRLLDRPPVIDGREWMAAQVQLGPAPRTVVVRGGRYTLTFRDAAADTGDVERYRLFLDRKGQPSVRIDDMFTSWAYVTPDARFIFIEPLRVLDVDAWSQYALDEAFGIENYTTVEAISRDERQLLISRAECAVDCPGQRIYHYELTLPR